MQNIGEVIYIFRRRAGLSQSQVAKEAGIHRNTLSALENGDVNVSIGVLTSICVALDRPLTILIGGAECHLTKRAADGLERVALHCTCPTDANHPDCPVHGTRRR